MSQTLTRRGLVAVAPAAVVAAALPAFAGAHPDAALLALREPYERTLAVAKVESPAHTRAEDAYFAAKTDHPDLDKAALEKMSGLDLAEARWQAALDANGEVIGRIVDTPAHTLAGMRFKAEICDAEDFHEGLAMSIVADLIAMGGAHA